MLPKRLCGFTLAELLIALGILGVIATFTIPKIITNQQNSAYNAHTKEAIAMVSGAFSLYKTNNSVTSGVGWDQLTPYMNYVRVDTVSSLDALHGDPGPSSCGGGWSCLRLHNGALLHYIPGRTFGGTGATNAIWFHFDPDGKVTDGTASGPGHAVGIFLYTTGRITDEGQIVAGTQDSSATFSPDPSSVPPWFSW